MTEPEVISLMMSSRSEGEWNDNCNKVKEAFGGGYPRFWAGAILFSGLAGLVQETWKE